MARNLFEVRVRILKSSYNRLLHSGKVLPVTGLKIVQKLNSSALLRLLACGGTCKSAVITVTRKCSDAIQYNESATFVKSCGLLCCALELCYRG